MPRSNLALHWFERKTLRSISSIAVSVILTTTTSVANGATYKSAWMTNRKGKYFWLWGPALLAAFCAPALPHHSYAMFDRTKLAVQSGTVRTFEWTNPHVYLW